MERIRPNVVERPANRRGVDVGSIQDNSIAYPPAPQGEIRLAARMRCEVDYQPLLAAFVIHKQGGTAVAVSAVRRRIEGDHVLNHVTVNNPAEVPVAKRRRALVRFADEITLQIPTARKPI